MTDQRNQQKRIKKNIKRPVTSGVARVPVVMQLEALECGAACLAMVLAYYGTWLPLEQVRTDLGISRDGCTMKHILWAAKNYGLAAKGYRMKVDSLQKRATYPCILHWNMNHFVVLCGFKGNKAVLNDPARGTVQVSMDEINRSFTGLCLLFEPSETFVPEGSRKSMITYARKRLKGATAMVAFVALITLISYLFGLINPFMSRLFYDRLLTGMAPDWLMPFIGALALIGLFQVITEWAKTVSMFKINGKMGIEGNASYMWKLLRLPMGFFSQRLGGDLLQRQEMNASIAGVLVQTVAPLFLNTVMMVFYLVVMLRYSVPMTMVGLFCLVVNLFTARYMSKRRVNMTRVQMRDEGKLSSATIAGISMAETIKAAGAEDGFFSRWSGFQAAVNKQQVKFTSLNIRVGMIAQFISAVSGYLVLFMGIVLAMNGSFTLGMIATFQGFLASFMGPAQTLISAGQTIQEMRTQMERVEDVMEYPEDPLVREEPLSDEREYTRIKGEVELKNVTFGYARFQKPVITDFSMHVKPGSRVAIVGASGCGKSTVSKLVTGLYRPWEGEIRIDGKRIEDIPRIVFTSSVTMVEQDIVLFEDTIANNIRMWDSTIEDFEVIMAARDAQIHDDILKRPGGYQGMLSENGRDLSGGQRQRLEIARALAMDPSILVMDEATSALDAKTEYELVEAVKKRGITCIIVAHRLSTIRDCDEIIVLDDGKIVERGTHEELYAKGGYYTALVTSE